MSKCPMRGHFRYLRFKTFPMTPRTPQCEVFCPLLSSSKHSGVPEDSKSQLFQVLGFTPTLGQSKVATLLLIALYLAFSPLPRFITLSPTLVALPPVIAHFIALSPADHALSCFICLLHFIALCLLITLYRAFSCLLHFTPLSPPYRALSHFLKLISLYPPFPPLIAHFIALSPPYRTFSRFLLLIALYPAFSRLLCFTLLSLVYHTLCCLLRFIALSPTDHTLPCFLLLITLYGAFSRLLRFSLLTALYLALFRTLSFNPLSFAYCALSRFAPVIFALSRFNSDALPSHGVRPS